MTEEQIKGCADGVLIAAIRSSMPVSALYEQLAEECAELGKAALKRARQLRGDNPTPVTEAEANEAVLEEANDVLNCLSLLNLRDVPRCHAKLVRWVNRLRCTGRL